MSAKYFNLKPIVAALFAIVMYSLPLAGQQAAAQTVAQSSEQASEQSSERAAPLSVSERLGALYDDLATASPREASGIMREIRLEWRKTGSPAMDLLLKRGRDALERGEYRIAIEHLTALTDHAPDVAEAYHARARAYFRIEQIGPALADLEQALALDPRHFEAAHGLAVVLEALDRPQQAFAAYRLVLSLHPHYDPAAEAVTRLKRQVEGLKL
ncbi:MAG: tetratricopeptide repeat protein [Rhodobacterales bacterium]